MSIRVSKKRKKKKPETIKSFHEHFEIYRLLLSTPIFRIATRICVRLAPPNVDRSTLRFAACQMRRILLLREWNSRDSNCFWKNFEMRRCYNRRYTSFYSIMSNIYIYMLGRLEYSELFIIYMYFNYFFFSKFFFLTNSNSSTSGRLKREFWTHTCVFSETRRRKFVRREVGREFSVDWV